MTTPKAAAKKSQAPVADENEIEEIMSEIEDLQKEMRVPSPSASVTAPTLKAVPSPSPSSQVDASLSPEEEEDILKEFQAAGGSGGDGGGLEDTLADLKSEDTGGKSLLDEAIASSTEDAAQEYEHEEVEEEAEALSQTTEPEIPATASDSEGETPEEDTMDDQNKDDETNGAGGNLTMTMTGNMTLTLKYASDDGQEVAVGFGGGCLSVRLADGTEFKIPVRRLASTGNPARKFRKAA